MTENLTAIERALLEEFERLGAEFEGLAQRQSLLSDHFSAEMNALLIRQNKLETHLRQVSEALAQQNRLTTDLIEKERQLRARSR